MDNEAPLIAWCSLLTYAMNGNSSSSLCFRALRFSVVDRDGLRVHEFANPVVAQLASITGMLYSSEGNSWVGSYHAVHESQPGFNFFNEQVALRSIVGPGAGTQAKLGVVGHADRFLHAADFKDGGNGSKQFILKGRRSLGDVRQHRWF